MHRLVFGAGLLGVSVMMAGCRTCSVPDGLIYYSTLDNAEAIENPVVGPKGKVINSRFVEGKKDGAFEVEGRKEGVLVDLPANFLGPQGTIEFWAKINNPKDYFVDGGDPRFFQIGNGKDFPLFFLEYAANDGGGNSGLHVLAADNWQSSFEGFQGSIPYSKILGARQADWHHYAITWNRDGEIKMAVYLDGVVQYSSKHFYTDEKMAECYGVPQVLSLGMTKGNHANLSKCNYAIDELKIWSVEKDVCKTAKVVEPNRQEPVKAKDSIPPADAQVSITLIDGSVIKGSLKESKLHVNSLIGPIVIPADKVKTVRFAD